MEKSFLINVPLACVAANDESKPVPVMRYPHTTIAKYIVLRAIFINIGLGLAFNGLVVPPLGVVLIPASLIVFLFAGIMDDKAKYIEDQIAGRT